MIDAWALACTRIDRPNDITYNLLARISRPERAGGTMATEGYARPELLVDAAWVDAHKGDANVVIVDCEVDHAYARGHISFPAGNRLRRE